MKASPPPVSASGRERVIRSSLLLTLQLARIFRIYFYVYLCTCVPVCLCVCTFMWKPVKAVKGCQIWMLSAEHQSYARAASALNL